MMVAKVCFYFLPINPDFVLGISNKGLGYKSPHPIECKTKASQLGCAKDSSVEGDRQVKL